MSEENNLENIKKFWPKDAPIIRKDGGSQGIKPKKLKI